MAVIENLDFFCVDFAKRISDVVNQDMEKNIMTAGEIGNALTESLSVLENNGVYAFLLYLTWKAHNGTRIEKRLFANVHEYLIGGQGKESLLRLKEIDLPIADAKDNFEVGKKLSEDLDHLFLAKDLLRRTLVYARYHAKAVSY